MALWGKWSVMSRADSEGLRSVSTGYGAPVGDGRANELYRDLCFFPP